MKVALELELAKRMRTATRWVEGQQGLLPGDDEGGGNDGFGRMMLVRTGALPGGADGVLGTTIDKQPNGAEVAGIPVLIKSMNDSQLTANTTYSARLGGYMAGKALYFVEGVNGAIGISDAFVRSDGNLYFLGNPTPYKPGFNGQFNDSLTRSYTTFGSLYVRATGQVVKAPANSRAEVQYMSTMFGILTGLYPGGTGVSGIYGSASDPLGLAIWQFIGQPLSALCTQVGGVPGTTELGAGGLGPWPAGSKIVINIRDRVQPTYTPPMSQPLGGSL